MSGLRTLFFDLDGTLIDSAVGITRCVAHALKLDLRDLSFTAP